MNLVSLLSLFSSEEIVSRLSDFLVLVDPSCRIIRSSPAFNARLGYEPGGLNGVPVSSIAPESGDIIAVRKCDTPSSFSDIPLRLITADGGTVETLVSAIPLRDQSSGDSIFGHLLICRENRPEPQTGATEQSVENSLVSELGRELGPAVNGIVSHAELLRRTTLDEKQSDLVDMISCTGGRLLSAIDDMHDYGAIAEKRAQAVETAYDIEQIICEVISVANVGAALKNLNISYRTDHHAGRKSITDPPRLRRILTILLESAVRLTESGDITIFAGAAGTQRPPMTLFEIEFGRPASRLPDGDSFFRPFSLPLSMRGNNSSGLSLAIADGAVRLLGGRGIGIAQAGPERLRFAFELPFRAAVDCSSARKQNPAAQAEEAVDAPGYSILLVEDNVSNAELLIELLTNFCGHRISWVQNGKLAVERISHEEFDLILMDIQMPVMDGKTAAKTIRRSGNDVPIIALTASVMPWDYEECISAGMNAYASKPVNIGKLSALIISVIEKNRREKQERVSEKNAEKAIVEA